MYHQNEILSAFSIRITFQLFENENEWQCSVILIMKQSAVLRLIKKNEPKRIYIYLKNVVNDHIT